MVRQKTFCCQVFKNYARCIGHIQCCKDRPGTLVSGRKLNIILGVDADNKGHMDPANSYLVCHYILKKAKLISPQDSRLRRKQPTGCPTPGPTRKSRRLEIQNPERDKFQISDMNTLKGISVLWWVFGL